MIDDADETDTKKNNDHDIASTRQRGASQQPEA